MAFQVLNLSIDCDYIRSGRPYCKTGEGYDDIDSLSELLIEKITGNDKYTSEEDDDNGQDKGVEKAAAAILYLERAVKNYVYIPKVDVGLKRGWAIKSDSATTCEGFFDIISPPPEASSLEI